MLSVLFTDLFNCNTSSDERDVILLLSLTLTFFLHLKTDLSSSCHVGLHSGINTLCTLNSRHTLLFQCFLKAVPNVASLQQDYYLIIFGNFIDKKCVLFEATSST